MYYILVTLLILLNLLDQAHYGFGELVVVPTDFVVNFDPLGRPSNVLSVTCRPPQEETTTAVAYIQLVKYRKHEEARTPVLTITSNSRNGFLQKEVGLADRVSNISGQIDRKNATSSFLHLDLSDAGCADEGRWECSVHVYSDGTSRLQIQTFSSNVTATVLPERVRLNHSPAYDSFLVNQTLEMHCSLQAGSPAAYLRWQYRRTNLTGEKPQDFNPLNFGVTRSEGPYPQGFCKQYRSSTLWLRTDLNLNGVELRCLPVRAGDEYPKLATTFTFKVKEAGCVPHCWNGGRCEQTTCRCLTGYSGTFCQHKTEPPCEVNCGEPTVDRSTGVADNLHPSPFFLGLAIIIIFILDALRIMP